MTFIRSQNHTSVLVGEHEVQTFEVVVVVVVVMDKCSSSVKEYRLTVCRVGFHCESMATVWLCFPVA
jgi:hypothetical protein